jgi:hypothetical protein
VSGLALTLPIETERLLLRAHRGDDLDDLLRKLGFRLEARHVDGALHKGQWATQLVFAMLEDEWRQTLKRNSTTSPSAMT